MEYLVAGLVGEWIEAAFAIVGIASAVAAMTPTRKDDDIVGAISRFIDIVALNIGYARRK